MNPKRLLTPALSSTSQRRGRKLPCVPLTAGDSSAIRSKIRQALEELDRGEGIPGKQAEAELKQMSKEFRHRKRK